MWPEDWAAAAQGARAGIGWVGRVELVRWRQRAMTLAQCRVAPPQGSLELSAGASPSPIIAARPLHTPSHPHAPWEPRGRKAVGPETWQPLSAASPAAGGRRPGDTATCAHRAPPRLRPEPDMGAGASADRLAHHSLNCVDAAIVEFVNATDHVVVTTWCAKAAALFAAAQRSQPVPCTGAHCERPLLPLQVGLQRAAARLLRAGARRERAAAHVCHPSLDVCPSQRRRAGVRGGRSARVLRAAHAP